MKELKLKAMAKINLGLDVLLSLIHILTLPTKRIV